MKDVCFVLSTGRCGTQSLAAWLSSTGDDDLVVTHEPLPVEYQSRRRNTRDVNDDGLPEEVLAHLAAIEKLTQTQRYVECGFPSWSTIPYLLRRFAGRIRIVQMVRHPVPVALSWITHGAYCPPLLKHGSERILLSPFDRAARHRQYRDRWAMLSPHEKVLYYWLEVHGLGAELQRSSGVPWLTVRFEDFVSGHALERMADFIGVSAPTQQIPPNVDRHRFYSDLPWDRERLGEHPEVLALMERLGYASAEDLQLATPLG